MEKKTPVSLWISIIGNMVRQQIQRDGGGDVGVGVEMDRTRDDDTERTIRLHSTICQGENRTGETFLSNYCQ